MVIIRNGKRETLNIVVGELADLSEAQAAAAAPGAAPVPSRIGVVVEALTDPVQQRAGVDHGVRVVEASGPAAEAGIREGDIITRLNNQEIDSPATFSKVVDSLRAGTFGAGADRAWPGADVPRVARAVGIVVLIV